MADEQDSQPREVISLETIMGFSGECFSVTMDMANQLGLPPFMHALALAAAAETAHKSLLLMAKDQAEVEQYEELRKMVLDTIPKGGH